MLNKTLLRQNTMWMLLGNSLRVVSQAASFIVVARSLGSEGYGVFMSVVALVAIVAPFASVGSGNILIKNVARDAKLFQKYWANALVITLCSGSMLLAIVVLISGWILPYAVAPRLILLVAVSDLFFLRLLDISGQSFQAFKHLRQTAQIHVLFSLSRFGAAISMNFIPSPTPVDWGLLYLCSTCISASIGIWLVHHVLGMPRLDLRGVVAELREGFYFSASLSAQAICNDSDKTLLARLATFEAAGVYAVAYRILDVSFTPVRSMLYASYANFFQQGAAGIRGTVSLAKRLLPFAATYALCIGAVLYLAAPLLPYLLGTDYHDATEAVRWLAVLPLLKTTQYVVADMLTGAGFQGSRTVMQTLVALFNVLLNLLLIPMYSWRGAVYASIISDAFLMLSLGTIAWRIARRERGWAESEGHA